MYEPIIEKIFLSKKYGQETIDKYGIYNCAIVYALYSDNTWEKICVYDDTYRMDNGKPINLSSRLKRKTKEKAIEIIDELFWNGHLKGKLII